MANLDELKKLAYALKNGVTEQFNQGAPYRQALSQALKGNLQPADQLFNTPQPVNEQQAVDVAMGFSPMALGTIGKVANKLTPFEHNHLIAQRNAVEMLGLPANNTAMDRAKAMGYDTPAFHGTSSDFSSFDANAIGKNYPQSEGGGFFFTQSPKSASNYALLAGQDGNNVMPLMLNKGEALTHKTNSDYVPPADFYDMQNGWLPNEAKLQNKNIHIQGTRGDDLHVIFEPKNIRSRFAAFDPAKRNQADLLGNIDPTLLATMAGGSLLGAGAYKYKKDK